MAPTEGDRAFVGCGPVRTKRRHANGHKMCAWHAMTIGLGPMDRGQAGAVDEVDGWNLPTTSWQTFDLIGQLFAKALRKKKCCIFDAVLHISPSFLAPFLSSSEEAMPKKCQLLRVLVLTANNLSVCDFGKRLIAAPAKRGEARWRCCLTVIGNKYGYSVHYNAHYNGMTASPPLITPIIEPPQW